MKEGKNNRWSVTAIYVYILKEVFYRNNYTLFRFRKLEQSRKFLSQRKGGFPVMAETTRKPVASTR